jgi:hypothetical protein
VGGVAERQNDWGDWGGVKESGWPPGRGGGVADCLTALGSPSHNFISFWNSTHGIRFIFFYKLDIFIIFLAASGRSFAEEFY